MGIWSLKYEGFNRNKERLREALCTLGNGYFATRGAAPESEASDTHYPGTYVAGCFNRLKSKVSGQIFENESMVNVPNWLPLTFRLKGGKWFDLAKIKLIDYRQELDLRKGVLTRFLRFKDKWGRRTRVIQRRFVHMENPHLAGLETKLKAENWSGCIDIKSGLDGRVTNSGVDRYRNLNNKHLESVQSSAEEEVIYLQVQTNQSHIRISEAARTRLFRSGELVEVKRHVADKSGFITQKFSVDLRHGEEVTIEKIVSLFTSKDTAISESGLEARNEVLRAESFERLLERHVLNWKHIWRSCRISLKGSARSQMILLLHVFHLLQTASPNSIDLDVGVPARGLHGEAYRGHYFWDELFVFPFFNIRFPDISRALLMYRYRRLSQARWEAKRAGFRGASYPWQSGSNGREETQKLHLNPRSGRWTPDYSHLQRHVNVAIAYSVWKYYQATGDLAFLSNFGAEIILEIVRYWVSKVKYNPTLDRFEITRVMGPDEYHDGYPDSKSPGLNNNSYTNLMVVWTLCRALDLLELLPEESRQVLKEKLNLKHEELEKWLDISRKMLIVFHDDGIISQFEGYERLKEFDWDKYLKKYGDIQRLDRILKAEGDSTNNYKLSKQADVLMLFYLLSAEELRQLFGRLSYHFEYDTIPKNIKYYLARTSHGSTLSRLVHSWILSRSHREKSWKLFKEALESDISDIQGGTTSEGIHLGAMAGTLDLIQRCYTGIETRDNILWLDPVLPKELRQLLLDICYRGHCLQIHISKNNLVIIAHKHGPPPIKIGYGKKVVEIGPGETVEFELL